MISVDDDPGPEPEMKWVPIEKLRIDHSYQRSADGGASRSLINDIAGNFKWSAFQPVTVVAHDDGFYNVVDGQHRKIAMIKRGGLPKVPCYIIKARNKAEEAQFFISLNRNRVRMHPIDMYHAELEAGDETSVMVAQVCKEAGVKICKAPFSSAQVPPGQLQAVGALRSAVEKYSKNAIVRALKTYHAAFPDTPGQLRQVTMVALFRLYSENLGKSRFVDDNRIATIVRTHKPQRMESAARLDESWFKGTIKWVEAFIVGEYNKNIPAADRLSVGS